MNHLEELHNMAHEAMRESALTTLNNSTTTERNREMKNLIQVTQAGNRETVCINPRYIVGVSRHSNTTRIQMAARPFYLQETWDICVVESVDEIMRIANEM